jgi:hypothetical protein
LAKAAPLIAFTARAARGRIAAVGCFIFANRVFLKDETIPAKFRLIRVW